MGPGGMGVTKKSPPPATQTENGQHSTSRRQLAAFAKKVPPPATRTENGQKPNAFNPFENLPAPSASDWPLSVTPAPPPKVPGHSAKTLPAPEVQKSPFSGGFRSTTGRVDRPRVWVPVCLSRHSTALRDLPPPWGWSNFSLLRRSEPDTPLPISGHLAHTLPPRHFVRPRLK